MSAIVWVVSVHLFLRKYLAALKRLLYQGASLFFLFWGLLANTFAAI
jgi:hypothetical protein